MKPPNTLLLLLQHVLVIHYTCIVGLNLPCLIHLNFSHDCDWVTRYIREEHKTHHYDFKLLTLPKFYKKIIWMPSFRNKRSKFSSFVMSVFRSSSILIFSHLITKFQTQSVLIRTTCLCIGEIGQVILIW